MIDSRIEPMINCCVCCGSPLELTLGSVSGPHIGTTGNLCDECKEEIADGMLLLVEVVDDTRGNAETPLRTGYIARVIANDYEGATPGLATIRKSDLQQFLGTKYNSDDNKYNKRYLPKHRSAAGP